ncbi:MAG: helix-turn-helix domain-containing protein [Candidatus Marsarchaeota archaeon]|nr:helix-turn-helix domain-containing protein [Candidatus Marsarchaeota archaeon]
MNTSFGAALRERRRSAGLSQRDLAQRAGLDFSYISKVENGRLPPPAADTIVSICNVLGVSAEEMLALTGKIPSEVQQTISTSKAAQEFLRHVQQMELTDDEWGRMSKSLQSLREKS